MVDVPSVIFEIEPLFLIHCQERARAAPPATSVAQADMLPYATALEQRIKAAAIAPP